TDRILKTPPLSFRTPRSGDPESRNTKKIRVAGFRVRAFSALRNDRERAAMSCLFPPPLWGRVREGGAVGARLHVHDPQPVPTRGRRVSRPVGKPRNGCKFGLGKRPLSV